MISMLVTVPYRSSSAIKELKVDALNSTAQCTFKNGLTYNYENVSKRAIINVLFNPDVSLGFWVNNNLVNTERTQIANDEYQELANRFTKLDNKLDNVKLPEFATIDELVKA